MLIVWASFKCEGSTATVLVFHMTVCFYFLKGVDTILGNEYGI